TISGGRIDILSDASLGTPPAAVTPDAITLNGGTLRNTNNFALDTKRGITLGASGGSIGVSTSYTLTFNGVIAGVSGGFFKKVSDGVLILGGPNTYDGPTLINNSGGNVSCELRLGASGVIPDNSAVGVTNATLNLNGFNETVGSLASDGNALIK